jgi:hypothetical protein
MSWRTILSIAENALREARLGQANFFTGLRLA